MPNILFVCNFNRCRSVIAEHIFRCMLFEYDEKLAQQIEVSSAGIFPRECVQCARDRGISLSRPVFGKAPNKVVIAALAGKGMDVSGYRSRGINRLMVNKADLTIAAVRAHKDGILLNWPGANGKTFTFNEFTGIRKYFIYDDCGTAPRELLKLNPHDDPDYVNGLVAETEEYIGQTMPKFLDYLQKKAVDSG